MTRRLAIAIIGTALAAVVMTGAVTLLIVNIGARQAATDQARDDVAGVAEAISSVTDDRDRSFRPPGPRGFDPFIRSLRATLGLRFLALAVIDADGTVVDGPADIALSFDQDDLTRLRDGTVLDGDVGNSVYAVVAVPAATQLTGDDRAMAALVAVRPVDADLGRAGRWFLVAAVVSVGLAAVVAGRLGRTLTAGVREVSEATGRIAAGDLTTRIDERPAAHRDELAELTRSVNSMADSLQRGRGLEQQFLLSVSHDLRTPMTSIRGYAEAIADGAVDDPAAAAEIISGETARLQRLIGDLLDLARLDASTFRLEPVVVDLDSLVADAVEAARAGLVHDGVEVALRSSDRSCRAHVDPDRLRQVLGNLLDNAGRHARSAVEVTIERTGDHISVVVADDGPGFRSEDLPHVFERLYVSRHRPVRRETGSGLGLAIARQLTEAMGGTIRAGNRADGGAALTLAFPGIDAPAQG